MEEVNFEEAMKKLEALAQELEKGDLDLDQSVQKFEEGMALAKKCNDILEKAEKRITILIQEEEGLKEENFVPQED